MHSSYRVYIQHGRTSSTCSHFSSMSQCVSMYISLYQSGHFADKFTYLLSLRFVLSKGRPNSKQIGKCTLYVQMRQRIATTTIPDCNCTIVLLPWRPFLSPDQCYTVGHWQKCWPRRRNPISVGVRGPNRVVRPASAPKTNNARRAARRKPAAVTVVVTSS